MTFGIAGACSKPSRALQAFGKFTGGAGLHLMKWFVWTSDIQEPGHPC